ncbi:hypothetical protein [Herpetosiphon llansteffanensis]|uniref:hypothetical protein n=1 Tax=Herpetosiphon llansteffanensis TaxID=2094568 RepID=UPI000D7BF54D|nr:hypothetical protein [Herpetosiphon llansteffanensis]
MPKEFTLLNLAPEPLVFSDYDGNKYDVLRPNQFGLRSLAIIDRLQTQIAAHQAELAALADVEVEDDEHETEYEHANQQFEKLLNSFIKAVVPKVTTKVCQHMSLVEKLQFMNWWREETAPKVKAPETAAGTTLVTKPIRKKSSRG